MTDILLSSDFDLSISATGDLVIGQSDQQHQELLLLLDKGSLKEYPMAGVGAAKYLEAEDTANFLREIRLQFSNDGILVSKIKINNDRTISIDANY